jgi:tight adherence protein B
VPAVLFALLAALAIAGAGREPGDRSAAVRRLRRYLEAPRGFSGSTLGFLDRYVTAWRAGAALQRRLDEAAVAAPISALLLGTAAATLGVGTAAVLCAGPAGVLAAVAVVAAALGALEARRARRLARIEEQTPAALDMLVGQLKSHRSAGEAIVDVSQWIADPLRGEFTRVADELRIGVPLGLALVRFRERVAVPVAAAAVTAIIVADRTGANLAECLTRQAASARTQIAFRQEVRAMTAHARTTGGMLALLPAGVAGAMLLFDSAAFAPMTGTWPGRVLLAAAAAMEFCGWQTIRWMVRRAAP